MPIGTLASTLWMFCLLTSVSVQTIHARTAEPAILFEKLDEVGFVYEMPAPITEFERARYRAMLVLSEPQAVYADALFGRYRNQCQELERLYAPQLFNLGQQFMDALTNGRDAVTVAALHHDLRTVELNYAQDLRTADEQALGDLQTILSDEQSDRLTRVRMHRDRYRCVLRFSQLRKARVDLSQFLERAEIDDDVRAACDALVFKYEVAITPLMVEASQREQRSKVAIEDLRAQALTLERSHSGSPDALRTCLDRMDTIRSKCAQSLLRIATINDEFVSSISAALPPQTGKQFQLAYWTVAYTPVYPDPLLTDDLMSRILEDTALSAVIRTAIEEQMQRFQLSYKRVNERMCDEIDRWERDVLLSGSVNGSQDHERAILAGLAERADLSVRFVTGIAEITSPLARYVQREIQTWLAKSKSIQQRLYAKLQGFH